MAASSGHEVTRLLRDAESGADVAADLLPLVYDQLKAIAAARMKQERAGHTLQATALVHEAYMKLVGEEHTSYRNRAHFYAIAAQAMRRILIDHARARGAAKRGGGQSPVPMSVVDLAVDSDASQTLALEEALTSLEREDAQAARVVELRFYAGLSVDETAGALDVSPRTVMREWAFARARLKQLLGDAIDGPATDT
jgi:RNA polymerase sigma factor (TIGR02999 family)